MELQQLRSGDTNRLTRRQAIEPELSLIEAHEKNLVDAIAKGQQMDALLPKLKAEEARKMELIEELGRLTQPVDVIAFDAARMKRELRSRISDAKGAARSATVRGPPGPAKTDRPAVAL